MPSPAMVVAVIALVIALTGSAWAALGKNTVGTPQLKNKSVTTGKIANNAVNGSKVKDGSLTGSDINLTALGTVPSATSGESASNADDGRRALRDLPSGHDADSGRLLRLRLEPRGALAQQGC